MLINSSPEKSKSTFCGTKIPHKLFILKKTSSLSLSCNSPDKSFLLWAHLHPPPAHLLTLKLPFSARHQTSLSPHFHYAPQLDLLIAWSSLPIPITVLFSDSDTFFLGYLQGICPSTKWPHPDCFTF